MSPNTWRWPSNFNWNCNFSLSSFRFAFIIFAFWSVSLACEQSEKNPFFSLQSEKKKGIFFAFFRFKRKRAAHPKGGSPKKILEKKNVFSKKYVELRTFDGIVNLMVGMTNNDFYRLVGGKKYHWWQQSAGRRYNVTPQSRISTSLKATKLISDSLLESMSLKWIGKIRNKL